METPYQSQRVYLGFGWERISAIVEMSHPGVWIMGDIEDDDRHHCMGIVVEYAGRTAKSQWIAPKRFVWNYAALKEGRRYRIRMRNAGDDIHPIHLHRHTFELTKVAGQVTAEVMKDVVMVGGYQEVEMDFTADNPGLTLFHCHQQLHLDFGFMSLCDYV